MENENEKKEHGEKKDSIEELLKKTLEISQKNQADISYIKRFVIWSQVWGAIKIFLILIPIVLGILYLPPFFKDWLEVYQELILNSVIN